MIRSAGTALCTAKDDAARMCGQCMVLRAARRSTRRRHTTDSLAAALVANEGCRSPFSMRSIQSFAAFAAHLPPSRRSRQPGRTQACGGTSVRQSQAPGTLPQRDAGDAGGQPGRARQAHRRAANNSLVRLPPSTPSDLRICDLAPTSTAVLPPSKRGGARGAQHA